MFARTLALIAALSFNSQSYAQESEPEELSMEEFLYGWIVPPDQPQYTDVIEVAGTTYSIRSNTANCAIWPVLEMFWCSNTFGDLKRDEEALDIYNYLQVPVRVEVHQGEELHRKLARLVCTKIEKPDEEVRFTCRIRGNSEYP